MGWFLRYKSTQFRLGSLSSFHSSLKTVCILSPSSSGGWDMQLDYSRQQDMEMLWEDYQNEKSPYWRERIERTMDGIMNESGASRQLRDELIRATRTNDRYRMDYLRLELRRLEAEKINNNIQL